MNAALIHSQGKTLPSSQYSPIGETFPAYELWGRSQVIAYPQPHRYQAFLVLDRYVGNKLPCWSHREVEPLFKLPSLSLASMCTPLKWARLSSSRVLIEYYAMLSISQTLQNASQAAEHVVPCGPVR